MRLVCRTLFAVVLGVATMTLGNPAEKPAAKTSPVLGHTMKSLERKPIELSRYQGKVLLIVNVASRCGATPQYEPLQNLYEARAEDGLVVLGFPCNQFGSQEPGSAAEIASFCEKNYGVTFPMFEKIKVNGEDAAPLYQYLTSREAAPADPGPVRWNFEKFLVGRDGEVIARFRTGISPDSPEVVAAIDQALAAKVE